MVTHPPRKEADIPASLAILLLAFILGFLFYLKSPDVLSFWQKRLDLYAETHAEFIGLVLLSLSINSVILGSTIGKWLSLNQQGKRLALLTGQGSRSQAQSVHWKSVVVALGLGVGTYFAFRFFHWPGQNELSPLPLSLIASAILIRLLQINFAASVLFIAGMVGQAFFSKTKPFRLLRRLPPLPKPKNGIVLGSEGDLDPNSKPEWVTLNRRALNGNLLITGSIGTGKTQGTILTYFDQLLANFDPNPSVLAIDPKGTFIPEALEIIKRHGLEKQVLHLKLGGSVTFNPILTQSPLKKAQFLETAQMIRAAAMNFHGRSSDSGFWETLAFNLKRNSLAYCSAKLDGKPFTLNHIYSEMIVACQDALKVSEDLIEFSKLDRFDEEEKYNLVCAAKYFQEFDQFDQKVKTGVLATATSFLNQFQEFQASQIFCPSEENLVIKSMDDVVDQGKILLFDISNPGLARSMGTFIKLHYEQSVLNRLVDKKRGKDRTAVIIADEYQDVVSTGGGATIGDDRFCAKSREANAVAIFATQSLTSIKNSVGKEDSAKELFQNFRTLISGHSTDLMTIHYFQELMGQEDKKKVSHSFSENAHHPNRNLILGGFEAKDANISESISTSESKEYSVTGKEFSTLSTFESFARIYDGNQTRFKKLYLKPYFLKNTNLLHSKVLDLLKTGAPLFLFVLSGLIIQTQPSFAFFPNVCTVVKTPDFNSCLSFNVGACMCGWPIPRPCAQFTYYMPQTFIEVFPDKKSSYFGALPGAAAQLATLGSMNFGAEADNDAQSFQAHAITVPLQAIPFETMPCGVEQINSLCFQTMSEHYGRHWDDGSGDAWQPQFLAWSASPKACIYKGMAESVVGDPGPPGQPVVPSCSLPNVLPKFPPSGHNACTGWGVFYPRYGTYDGPSQTIGALMIAARLKSLGNEVAHTVQSGPDDLWQMISPQASSCFREGQNVGVLETAKRVTEEQRLANGKTSGYLFTVWNRVSCCRDLAEIPTALAAIAAMNLVCQGLGSL